ncbi:NAD(P)/FAD-dependent oxidoreductase [Actinomadura macrotermitis]|uniref:Anthranilate 1,2-dioxygenase system ferredoxin--NAD(+) reductase component n=1 Tax=Actinomadura macrotermitis TaxID=2585200 RepID=A0A7K0BNF2_9ACTN|nr:FAD-dependent oxidoreductase [Actinomadura macrotermitis]MQY02701.1 Anthranilate 1,2-dioxygenase system ferredoxin--NAD(+) reductase component [Actinomadura macrotermitis]
MPEETFVVVGAGLAGAKAAETLREEGFAGRVLLFGEEVERPYERPPLSKGFLLGKEPRDKAHVHAADWYDGHGVEAHFGTRVRALDRTARQVVLESGERIGYDRLLLATGASPRRLDVPGARLAGIHYLRTLGDSARLREALAPGGRRVVIAGAGWIGLETAAAARAYGNDVTVIEPQPVPLYGVVGEEVGRVFADLHRRHGVVLRPDEGVAGFWGAGQVSAVVTAGGAEIPADVVVVGIGATPNTGLAEAAGLEVDNGIRVDEALRTSDPAIFAAGDVANAVNPLLGRRVRVEHWENALNGGPLAARSMLGQQVSYDKIPYFFTDQYDLGMEMSGAPAPGEYDRVVFRGDPASLEFVAFWLAGDRVVAGMNVNVWDVTGDIQGLIRSGWPVDPARLADPGVPLGELVSG